MTCYYSILSTSGSTRRVSASIPNVADLTFSITVDPAEADDSAATKSAVATCATACLTQSGIVVDPADLVLQ